MLLLIISLGAVVALVVAAAVIDVKARRRGIRYTGVDRAAARDARRRAQTDLDLRGNGQFRDLGGGGF